MPRLVSFIVLVAVLLLVTALFFRVMLEFLVPMFLAAVLVVVFRPLHKWFQLKLAGHPRLAAAATTLTIVLIVLLPSVAIGWNAYLEVATFVRQVVEQEPTELKNKIERANLVVTDGLQEYFNIRLSVDSDQAFEALQELLRNWAGAALVGAQWLLVAFVRLVVGLVIMIISIYYFLADGPAMIVTIMHLSPLDDRYELELFERFNNISRSVVVATLLSAFVQGVLAGIGYYFAGIHAVFALTGLTMLLAVVPFLGAASVWVPTAAWLFFAEGRMGAAIGLTLYGAAVVSTIDNVIKPYVLHGQSNLHPLLALLSVLGGVAALGPIGILVGPMAVAFLQALLGMLRREIHEIGVGGDNTPATGNGVQAPAPPASDLPATEPAIPSDDQSTSEPRAAKASPPKQHAAQGTNRKSTSERRNKRRKRT